MTYKLKTWEPGTSRSLSLLIKCWQPIGHSELSLQGIEIICCSEIPRPIDENKISEHKYIVITITLSSSKYLAWRCDLSHFIADPVVITEGPLWLRISYKMGLSSG